MSVQMVASIIQVVIVPVVMITSCSILLGGILGHYAAINDRVRTMARERLDLLRTGASGAVTVDALNRERLEQIDIEIPELLRRHQMVQQAVTFIYSAILIFMADMFVIALAVISDWTGAATGALILFLAGVGALLCGVLTTTFEIRASHRAVTFEAQRVLKLGQQK